MSSLNHELTVQKQGDSIDVNHTEFICVIEIVTVDNKFSKNTVEVPFLIFIFT